jgi:hypothetical protein
VIKTSVSEPKPSISIPSYFFCKTILGVNEEVVYNDGR